MTDEQIIKVFNYFWQKETMAIFKRYLTAIKAQDFETAASIRDKVKEDCKAWVNRKSFTIRGRFISYISFHNPFLKKR